MAQKHNLTVQAISVVGGILAAVFFLGFLALARILRSEASCLSAGSLLIIATLAINRLVLRSFLDAMNITLYIAGCVLVAFGFGGSMNMLFIVLMGTGILTFLLSKGYVLPFLSVIVFIISLFGEITRLFSFSHPLQVAAVPVLATFLLIHLFEGKLLRLFKNDLPKYRPFHSGLFVSCLILMCGLSVNYLASGTDYRTISCILSVFIWTGLLIMAQRIMRVMQTAGPVHRLNIYILCIFICLPTISAPYLSGSLLLILVCFHYGYKTECAVSILLFIYAVSKYYYDLNMSLLTKSVTLFLIGTAFIAAWYFFTQKRTRHEKV